jgi:hypothetical protein
VGRADARIFKRARPEQIASLHEGGGAVFSPFLFFCRLEKGGFIATKKRSHRKNLSFAKDKGKEEVQFYHLNCLIFIAHFFY